VLLTLLSHSNLYAQSDSATHPTPPQILPDTQTLPDIVVQDSSATTTPGTSLIDRDTIDIIPHGDGNVTDLMRALPGVQYSESERSSLTGGGILPAEISISGGRVYDNNFLIDGLGNNSLLDPTENSAISIPNVAGHSQELFIDSSLIESVTVQRSNISARYSGFTGGVVELKTRNPAEKFSGKLSYRTTRSEWTSFHVEREDLEAFETSETAAGQPEYRKQHANFSLDIPIGEKMGVLLSYSQSYSKIPLLLLGTKENQYRKSQNFLAKYLFQPDDKTEISATFLWTPYEGDYFLRNTLNSEYTLMGGGMSLNTSVKRQFNWGRVESVLGWRESENSRRAPNDYYVWSNEVEKTDWGIDFNKNYSFEGGYGDIDTKQETYSLANHVDFNSLDIFNAEHVIACGVTFERSKVDYERHNDMSSTMWKPYENVTCGDDDHFCVPGQQWAFRNVVSEKDHASAEISFVDLYIENSIQLGRVTLRPGLHAGYNDLMKNMDYAARSLILYDVFADRSTVLSAGANRYYGKTFLTYALYEQRKERQTFTRDLSENGAPGSWENKTRVSRNERFSQLDTPYVDEWSIGLDQELFGGLLSVIYIDRNSEDQFARTNIDIDKEKFYELNNNGESRHEEVTASWEWSWGNHYLLINGTWQDSNSSNEDYDTTLEEDDLNEDVCYEGKIVSKLGLPRIDYNREWVANLVYNVALPKGFSFTNILNYRSGYAAITNTYERCKLDESLYIYEEVSYPSATTFDWKLTWECDIAPAGNVMLSAEVYNVLNRKLYTGIDGEYEMGRQLWVGMDYTF